MSKDKNKLDQDKISTLIESFEPGDFLFGLEESVREIYYYDLREKLVRMGAKYQFVTVDDFIKPLEPFYIYDDQISMSPIADQSSPLRNYGRLLLSSEDFTEIARQISSPTKKEKSKLLIACLLALEHNQGNIHFCLDRLDLNMVRSRHPQHRQYYEGFTSQELRYIAAHHQEVGSKVIFYLRGERVPAPWEMQQQSPGEWLRARIEVLRLDTVPIPGPRLAPHRINFNAMGEGRHREENETENSTPKRAKFINGDEIFDNDKRNRLH